MMAKPFGASGAGTSQRSTRKRSPAIHSKTTRPPSMGDTPGNATRMVHSPMKGSNCLFFSSIATTPPLDNLAHRMFGTGWFMPFLVAGNPRRGMKIQSTAFTSEQRGQPHLR